ncbi:Ornithine decarboxylase [Geodia barretti]|uniref:ornithine decarboxylase n=1 Tax=Geodia barretti TaxID=519541 RepID=A0AA35SA41_GEOBA|nr:Ornithine decarboxylase [Geodia barretti]
MSLALKSGDRVPVVTVATGTTLGAQVQSQVSSTGREDREDPFYLVDLGRLVELHQLWSAALPGVHPFYAVKCNNDPVLMQTLAALGCGFDCASKAEIKSVLDLGVSSKVRLQKGVATMTFDNEVELYKVKTHYPTARLVLRIRADDPSALCQLGVKFGCTVDEGKKLLLRARDMELCVVGISNEASPYLISMSAATPRTRRCSRRLSRCLTNSSSSESHSVSVSTSSDIGGGFPGTRDSEGFFTHLTDVLKEGLGRYFSGRPELKIIAEPGRFFACSTHTLAVNIISKREVSVTTPNQETTPTFMYFVNDGVYGSFNCILYDHITPTPFVVKSPPAGATVHASSLWGPTCDGLDKICDSSLPLLQVGDWLYFPDMGAYTVSAASNFNGFTKPMTYYAVSEDLRQRFLTVWNSELDSGAHFRLPPPPPLHRDNVDDDDPQLPLATTDRPGCCDNLAAPPQELVPVF